MYRIWHNRSPRMLYDTKRKAVDNQRDSRIWVVCREIRKELPEPYKLSDKNRWTLKSRTITKTQNLMSGRELEVEINR